MYSITSLISLKGIRHLVIIHLIIRLNRQRRGYFAMYSSLPAGRRCSTGGPEIVTAGSRTLGRSVSSGRPCLVGRGPSRSLAVHASAQSLQHQGNLYRFREPSGSVLSLYLPMSCCGSNADLSCHLGCLGFRSLRRALRRRVPRCPALPPSCCACSYSSSFSSSSLRSSHSSLRRRRGPRASSGARR